MAASIKKKIALHEQRLEQLAQVRFVLFLMGFGVNTAVFLTQGAILWGIIAIPAFVPFIVAVVLYNQQHRALVQWQQWLMIKQTHLARISLDWDKLPNAQPVEQLLQEHPFALDFDLVGNRSLHQLVDTAVTQEGSDRLQDWLLDKMPQHETVMQRQQIVRELIPMTLFRDKLTLRGTAVSQKAGKFPGKRLTDWLKAQKPAGELTKLLLGMFGLSLLTVVLLLFFWERPFIWVPSWVVYLLIAIRVNDKHSGTLFKDATFLAEQLEILSGVFRYLETVRVGKRPFLTTLLTPFRNAEQQPSRAIGRLQRVMIGVGLRENPLIGFLLNIVVPWDLLFVYLLRQRQAELREKLPSWLDVWYELEALCSLGNFAHLNVGLVSFPQLVGGEMAVFTSTNLAHPLIPDEARVGNNFTVNHLGEVAIITGSNMSGKSSFLRTIGLNLALAYAGSPVMADALTTTYFRLYSSIRVADSLQDGFSFFYAEVRRLKAILEAAEAEEKRPLFFFIDEIFRGTNNRERLIGSRAFIQTIVGKTAVGLVATHDLELVKLADTDPNIVNYHFRDDVADGKMVFDYTLRSGPSPTTNALKIMRLAGLPVGERISD